MVAAPLGQGRPGAVMLSPDEFAAAHFHGDGGDAQGRGKGKWTRRERRSNWRTTGPGGDPGTLEPRASDQWRDFAPRDEVPGGEIPPAHAHHSLNLEKAVPTTKPTQGHETLAAPLRQPLTRQGNIRACSSGSLWSGPFVCFVSFVVSRLPFPG